MRRSPKKSCVSCYYGSAKGSRFTSHADPKNVFFTRPFRTRHQTPRKARELQRVCACKLSRFSYDCSDRNGTNPRGESSPIAGDAVPSPSVAFGPAASVPALAILCRLDDRSTPFPPAAAPRSGGEPLHLRLQAGVLADHALHALLHLAQALHQRRVLRLVPADLLVQHRDVLELPPARPPRRLAVGEHAPLPPHLVGGLAALAVLALFVVVRPRAVLGGHRALLWVLLRGRLALRGRLRAAGFSGRRRRRRGRIRRRRRRGRRRPRRELRRAVFPPNAAAV